MTGTYVKSIFKLLKTCRTVRTVFQSGCTILHSHQQHLVGSVLNSSHLIRVVGAECGNMHIPND